MHIYLHIQNDTFVRWNIFYATKLLWKLPRVTDKYQLCHKNNNLTKSLNKYQQFKYNNFPNCNDCRCGLCEILNAHFVIMYIVLFFRLLSFLPSLRYKKKHLLQTWLSNGTLKTLDARFASGSDCGRVFVTLKMTLLGPRKLTSMRKLASLTLYRLLLRSGELVLNWLFLITGLLLQLPLLPSPFARIFSASACNLLSNQWTLSKSLVPPTVCLRFMDLSGIPFFRFSLMELSLLTDCRRLLMFDSVFSFFVNDSDRFNFTFFSVESECWGDWFGLFKLSERFSLHWETAERSQVCLFRLSDRFSCVAWPSVRLLSDSDLLSRERGSKLALLRLSNLFSLFEYDVSSTEFSIVDCPSDFDDSWSPDLSLESEHCCFSCFMGSEFRVLPDLKFSSFSVASK